MNTHYEAPNDLILYIFLLLPPS